MGLTALIPAAGKAERLYGLPKFLLPVPGGHLLGRHLGMHQTAGVENVYVGTIPAYSALVARYCGDRFNPVYHVHSAGNMVDTVRSGKQYTGHRDVMMTMPDTYIEDGGLLGRMREALGDYEMVVGVVETRPEQRHKLGMCVILNDQVVEVVDKPLVTRLVWAWGALAWRAAAWQWIERGDAHFGVCLNRAIRNGIKVGAVYAEGQYWDCGTLDEYTDCLIRLREQSEVQQ